MAFCCLPCACAGAGAHLEKTGFRSEGVSIFALRRLSRAAKNIENSIKKQLQKQLENAPHNAPIKNLQNLPKCSKNGAKMAPKSDPGGLPEAPEACRRAPAHPRSTQEQQSATKKRPRATQERPKSARKRFSRIFLAPGGPPGEDPRGAPPNTASGFRAGGAGEPAFSLGGCADFLVFSGSSEKWPPLS